MVQIRSAAFCAMLSLALAGCHGPPEEAYRASERSWILSLPRRLHPWHDGCDLSELQGYPSDTPLPTFLPTDACFKLRPPERLSGIWQDRLDGSILLPGAVSPDALRHPQEIWINRDQLIPDHANRIPTTGTRVLWVSFVGRRTPAGKGYGSWSEARGEVMVDRVIAIRDLGPAL